MDAATQVLGWVVGVGGAFVLALMALWSWLKSAGQATSRPRPVDPPQMVLLPYEPAMVSEDYEQTVERLRLLEENAARRLRDLRGGNR
jgi:hypothetical protein